MDSFIDELAQRFDYVIIDSAPILAVSDAAALSQHVDGVLLVVQAKRVTLGQLRASLSTLERVGAPLLGLVLTRAKIDNEMSGEYEYLYPGGVKARHR
jgi:Mrp family chromosome partitioning ATPase